MPSPLPIDPHLPRVLAALRGPGAAVVVAPPGSGKTTRVPPAIADSLSGKVLVTQPRRVAARLAARRIAEERGVSLGREVGYSTRFDRRAGPLTRIELLTQGLLVRRLQADPFLDGVDCVVLDEFHERTLDSDLALALLADCRREARQDLRIVVMSATLDPAPVAAFLDDCPVIEAPGRTFPVVIEHAPRPSSARVEARCAAAVRRLLGEEPEGHVLVFLPGVAEIARTERALREQPLPGATVLPLHGRLPLDRQAAALAPSDRRKVVLSTNIAETSITLDGARAVVDSGLARAAHYDPAVGLSRLLTAPISRASADQRAGRAGRTGPGRALRLWTEAEHRSRPAAEVPELRRADLSGLVLQVLAWGSNARSLRWFESPPPAALARAEQVLVELGALDGRGITSLGRALASLPLHPRLGAVLLEGRRAGIERTAATLVTLISERDPFRARPQAPGRGDLEPRLAAIEEAEWRGRPPREADPRLFAELLKVRDQLSKRVRRADSILPDALEAAPASTVDDSLPALVRAFLAGFPGRLARRRAPDSNRYLLASGHGAVLRDDAEAPELLLAVDLASARRGERMEHRIRLAHPVEVSDLDLRPTLELRFDPEREAVVQRRVTRIGSLVLRDEQSSEPAGKTESGEVLLTAALAAPTRALSPSPEAEQLLARLRFTARLRPDLLLVPPEDWTALLPRLCAGRRSFAELRSADLREALLAGLNWKQRTALDQVAPERVRVPSGSSLPLDYTGDPPVLAVRIQQMFGASATPTIADGRVAVMLHLLAPNRRPVQVTRDLAGFWERTYPEVRKQLRGRYPKHPWPEDPASAEATNRAKPRRR